MYEGSTAMTSPDTGATPPAPPVSLTALLARRDLGLRLLAGPEDVSVHWVHTSEMADPYPYLLGGELLMTAGVQLADPAQYVERVVEAGAAALAFGVTPVYDTVPAELVEACDRHGLPAPAHGTSPACSGAKRGARSSPYRSRRGAMSSMRRTRDSGSAQSATSSQVTGAETAGRARARRV